ncbi:uncharacterized protein B0J16DRAFT_419435 [Fusarium flagelliforme]|uniref:uncharacterized protein n=1 Tax=Fusarium flagelliforme TaxID=2675880 RepID=UPI001E8D6AAE|nr:uncharacterized protein B0J16DRAFT_419435 [Fusarium flagelliforme]KAH7168152.1 hypothetical protein B0J16DRAFT_419435 [Fusarium flagelliforme]
MSYPYCLPADSYKGDINSIRVRWEGQAMSRLQSKAVSAAAPLHTLKALSENFVYLLAYRLGNADALITAAPHETTTNSATGVTEANKNHISAQIQGRQSGGRKKVHIYLEGVGRGPGGYDNVSVKGESVMVKRGKRTVLDTSLSSGTYPTVGGSTSGTVGYGGGGSTSQMAGYGGGASTYGAAGYGSGVSWSGQQQQQQQEQSEWVWYKQYQKWYHPGTGQWQ